MRPLYCCLCFVRSVFSGLVGFPVVLAGRIAMPRVSVRRPCWKAGRLVWLVAEGGGGYHDVGSDWGESRGGGRNDIKRPPLVVFLRVTLPEVCQAPIQTVLVCTYMREGYSRFTGDLGEPCCIGAASLPFCFLPSFA